MRLTELMGQLNFAQADPAQMLAIVQDLAEMDGIHTPVMKRGQSESVRASQAVQRFGQAIAPGLQPSCQDQFEFWAR